MRFIIRRAGFFLLTLWAALSLNFFLPRIMPGNPINNIISKLHNVTPAQELAIERALGIDNKASIWQQYLTYIGNTAQGRLGLSLGNGGEPVSQLIRQALPWTLGLIGITTILAFIIGTAIGAIAAWRRGSRLDSALPPLFVFTTAIPFFWVGMMLILIFSSLLGVPAFLWRLSAGHHTLVQPYLHRPSPGVRDPASADAADHEHRGLGPHHAQYHGDHADRGLRAHGTREGPPLIEDHGRLRGA